MNNSSLILLFLTLVFSPLAFGTSFGVKTYTLCVEDHDDGDGNDFCGRVRELSKTNANGELVQLIATFNPIAMGAEHNLRIEMQLDNGVDYHIRSSDSSVNGTTNITGETVVLFEDKFDAFGVSSGLVNTASDVDSSNFIKGKTKTIFLWFETPVSSLLYADGIVDLTKFIRVRNRSLSPEVVYKHDSVHYGAQSFMIFPFDRPISKESTHFYDGLVKDVSGSDTLYSTSEGSLRASECDPRINPSVACREALAQFISSNNNIASAGNNVDLSENTIPETVVPELSPTDVNNDRLNINDHLMEIFTESTKANIQNKSYCELYVCPTNENQNAQITLQLINPQFNNASNDSVEFKLTNVLTGDSIKVYTENTCSGSSVAQGVVSGNELNLTISSISVGSHSFYYQITNLDGVLGSCDFGFNYTRTNFSLSGLLSYDYVPITYKLDYDNTRQEPIRNAVVEVYRKSDDTLIEKTSTNDQGHYSVNIGSAQDVYAIVYSKMETPSVSVIDNTNSGAIYAAQFFDSTVSNNLVVNFNAPSGWGGGDYTSSRVAAPFAILDSIYTVTKAIQTSRPSIEFVHLDVNWSVNNVSSSSLNAASGQILTSHYNPGTKQLYILGMKNADTDEYDRHIIVHEWSHFFEDNNSRSDSMGGQHGYGDIKDMSLAFGEGFATAIAGIVFNQVDTSSNSSNSYKYADSYGYAQASGYQYNMENGTDNSPGWFSESSVIQLLFDVGDSMAEAHDTLSEGIGSILDVMTGSQKLTSARTSIFTFFNGLKNNLSDKALEIDALTTNKSIEPVVDDFASTEDNFAGWNSMSSVYETLVIDGASVSNLALGGNSYLYNDMRNNRYVKFVATSTSTQIFISANNPGFVYYIGITNKATPYLFTISGNNYANVGSVNGNLGFVMATTPGETYIIRIFSSTNVSSVSGEMNLSVTGSTP